MAIPSRQIGWGTEENLLWQISKQLEAITGVAYNSSGGIVGPQGPQGVQGIQGTTGETGAALTVLGSYPDLPSFLAGAGGLPGAAGDAWIILSDGSLYVWNTDTNLWDDVGDLLGPAGPQGQQGVQGEQGIQGQQGIQGIQGIQGETGSQGVKGDQGDTGAQGAAGNSVTILGSYADLAAFNAGAGSLPGANIGDSWILLSDGSLMTWNGSVWFDAGDIKGPQGDTGATGATGAKGDKGDTGAKGDQGIQGIQGIQGVKGDQGIQGVQGETGAQGAAGGFGYLGSFYDTTNQTGVANSVLTMAIGNSDPWNDGVSITSGNRITIANPGVYNIAFSAQMVKNSGNNATHAHIWLSQNGVDVPVSASQISFPSNSVYVVAAWNFFFKTTVVNEYVQLKWEINSNADNAVVITSATATGDIPAIPGLIVTVNQVGA